MTNSKLKLKELLPEKPSNFPSFGKGIKPLRGKTLTKTGSWIKAVVLVDINGKRQLRLYGWRKNKSGEYKNIQRFNISRGYAERLIRILDYFILEGEEKNLEFN